MNNRFFLVLMVLVILSSPIYAGPPCWDNISCTTIGDIDDGDIIYPDYLDPNDITDDMCVLQNVSVGEYGLIEIELISGGHKDGVRNQNWLVTSDYLETSSDKIYFYLSRYTSPVYLNCYGIDDSVASYGGNYYRTALLQTFVVAHGNDYFDYSEIMNWKNQNPIYIGNDYNTTFDVNNTHTATVTKSYQNLKSDTTDWFMYGITFFMFIIGLLLVFTTVIQYYKRKK